MYLYSKEAELVIRDYDNNESTNNDQSLRVSIITILIWKGKQS